MTTTSTTSTTTNADLSGKTAVVTGASSGIGRAIAEALGGAGAHVVLAGRTEAAMKTSAEQIRARGGDATVVVTDVRDPAAVQALVDTAVETTGRLDAIVNNAGVAHRGGYRETIVDADPEGWREMLETNLLALLVGCQAGVRAMRACGAEGHVINISSMSSQRPDTGVYGATKHAVNVISNSLREELADEPIQVVTIVPGAVATNFARHMDPDVVGGLVAMSGIDTEVVRGARLPDEVLDAAQEALSEMLIRPADVADAVLYAVSRPPEVDIAQIIVRPNKDLPL